jgi:hypothetical protein
MKKLLIAILMLSVSFTVSAKKKQPKDYFFGSFYTGYHMPAGKMIIGTAELTSGGITVGGQNFYGSYGKGLKLDLAFGYVSKMGVGFQVDLGYNLGMNNTNTYISTDPLLPVTGTMNSKVNFISFAPQVLFKSTMGMYSRIGFLVPFGAKMVDDESLATTFMGTPMTINAIHETSYGLKLGFVGAVGYSLPIGKFIEIFGELNYIGLNLKSKSSTLTKYTVDGVDGLADATTSEKEIEYVDELLPTDNTDPNQPTKALAIISPISSFGLNFGISFKF